MKTAEIQKLNQNIETLNSNLVLLISLMTDHSSTKGSVVQSAIEEVINSVPVFIVGNQVVRSGLKITNSTPDVQTVEIQDEAIHSNCFHKVAYNFKTNNLTVQFKQKGKKGGVYAYSGVSQELYSKFVSSESLGRFFLKNIKPRFNFKQVG